MLSESFSCVSKARRRQFRSMRLAPLGSWGALPCPANPMGGFLALGLAGCHWGGLGGGAPIKHQSPTVLTRCDG
jgi:hypothetical protein